MGHSDIAAALHTAAIERLAPVEETLLQQVTRFSQTYQSIATQHGLQFGFRSNSPESWLVKIFDAEGKALYSDTIKRKNSITAFLTDAEAFKAALLELPFRLSSLSVLINQIGLEMGVPTATFKHPEPVAAPVVVEVAEQLHPLQVQEMALPKNSDIKYVAYYRVSTARQGRSGLGLEAQQEQVHRFVNCDECIIGQFTEVESGKVKNRPELNKALALCKETGATLIIAKLDRLGRDVEFIFSLINNKIKIKAADLPDFNTLTIGIFAAYAQYERELISGRTKAAFKAKKARGEVKGYGKTMTPEKAKAGTQATKAAADADEHNLRAFPLIESMRKEGKTYREIADKLNSSKYKTKNGKPYSASTVLRIERRYSKSSEVSN